MGAPKFDQDMADRDAQADSANPNELSQRFANQSASGAQTMSVQVLPGLQGGMYMQVQTPNGLMQVQIPRGLQPGMAFHIQVPQPTAVELTGVSLTSRNEGDLERGGGAPAAEGSVVQPQGTPRARPQSASTSREGRNVAAARRRQEAARARANAEEKAAAAAATESDAQEAAAAAECSSGGGGAPRGAQGCFHQRAAAELSQAKAASPVILTLSLTLSLTLAVQASLNLALALALTRTLILILTLTGTRTLTLTLALTLLRRRRQHGRPQRRRL